MSPISEEDQNLTVSLMGLLTIDIVLLCALFSQVDPHPPGYLGPFIGTMISLGTISLALVLWQRRIGLISSMIYGALNVLAVGPQKFVVDPNGEAVAPVIVLGTILIGALFYSIELVWKKGVTSASSD
jgi:hypothetical protein